MFFKVSEIKTHLIAMFFILTSAAVSIPAHAYYYTGGDWGGRDLTLLDGDTLSGNFSNVGQFYIASGVTISGSTDNLVVHANSFLIDGSLTGIAVPGYSVELYSLTDLILNGSIRSWQNIALSATQIYLNAGSSIITGISGGSGSFSLIGGNAGSVPQQNGASGCISLIGAHISDDYRLPQAEILGSGGRYLNPTVGQLVLVSDPARSVSLAPTPIPAAAYLFGSGLLGLAGIRRRNRNQYTGRNKVCARP